MFYKFTVEAKRKNFMEPITHEPMEYFFQADSFQQAHSTLFVMLKNGGWTAEKVTGHEIFVVDAREENVQ